MHNFLLEQKIKNEEIDSLELFIKSNPEARELKRALAVKMALQGNPYKKISQLLGVSKFFISNWKKVFITKGVEGIKLQYKGSESYLSAEQMVKTVAWLKSRQYWHLDELVNYLDNQYGVIYKSKESYYHIFSLANISWKKSQKYNPKFDEELVKKKTEEINHILAENHIEIESGRTVVLFLDECHLLHGDICGYVWGQTNVRIEIPMDNERNRQTYFGALNYHNHEFTMKSYPSGNGISTVEFVKYLQNKYAGSKLILIWDGASYHKFGEFRDYLEEVNCQTTANDWLITCILFAPNAPEQNPVEDVWLQAKNFLRKYWHLCRSFQAIKILFELFANGQRFDFPKVYFYQSVAQLI